MLLLGYEKNHKAYRLLNADDVSIVISRSVTFSGHPKTQTSTKQVQQIFDIDDDDEDDISTSSSNEVEVKTTQMRICSGHRRCERTRRQNMMLKNDQMVQFQLEHQVPLDETVKRSG